MLGLSSADAKALQGMIERWRGDPIAFVLEVFGPGYEAETGEPLVLDRWQENFLRALVGPKRRIAAKACKGPGKTAVLSWVGWWFLETRPHAKGAATSITGDNLDDGLWTELALWQRRSPLLAAAFEHKGEVIEAKDHPETWFLSKRTFRQDADKTQQAETLAGLHAASVFFLLDEMGGYPPGVLPAAEAIFNVKGVDGLIVGAGNPTSMDGPLYRICTEDADRWHVEEITGDPDDPNRSSRIDIEEARQQIRKYGRNDPVVMVNILGMFPPRADNKLLGPDDVTRAMRRDPQRRLWEQEPTVWGLDVAAGGLDSSVLFRRQGLVAWKPEEWRDKTDDALADQVALRYHQARANGQAPRKLFIDRGGVGRGVWTRLKSLLGERIVVGVDFGEMALEDVEFADRRTEMWCRMAEWVRDCGALPSECAELRIDLTGPTIGVSQTVHKGTRRKLESKEQMRKRGLKSPDHGDGLALTFAAPVLSEEMESGRHHKAEMDFDPIEHLSAMGGN